MSFIFVDILGLVGVLSMLVTIILWKKRNKGLYWALGIKLAVAAVIVLFIYFSVN